MVYEKRQENQNRIRFARLLQELVDTEVMLAKLVSAGYEITPEDIEADVIIVNTCAFIESAKMKRSKISLMSHGSRNIVCCVQSL